MKTPNDPLPGTTPDSIQASIDAVLTGLREIQPAPNFERRLLETLASHPAALPHAVRRWSQPSSWLPLSSRDRIHLRPGAWTALAATVALTLSLAFLRQHHQPVPTTRAATPSPAISSRPSIAAAPPSGATRETCCHSEPSEEPSQLVLSHGAQRRTPAIHTKALRLASYPAPPMPLTDQEKLLLRAAHSADPQHSAVLDPNLQARAEAASAAEFQLFFVAATTIRNQEPPPD